MPEEKKSFKLYFDQYEPTRNLSDECKARLWDAVFQFNMGEDVHLGDPLLEALFTFFRQQFQRNNEAYAEKCRKNSENGSKGGRPRKSDGKPTEANETEHNPEKPNGFFENPSEPKKADNDNDNDIINTPPTPPTGEGEGSSGKKKQSSRGEYPADFLVFWDKYPRKDNKRGAWKAYSEAKKAGRLPPDLLERLANKCLCDQWRKDGGQYIPYAERWLKKDGWDDEDCAPPAEESYSAGWEEELDKLNEIGKRCEVGIFDSDEERARKNEVYKREYEPMWADMRRRGCRAI